MHCYASAAAAVRAPSLPPVTTAHHSACCPCAVIDEKALVAHLKANPNFRAGEHRCTWAAERATAAAVLPIRHECTTRPSPSTLLGLDVFEDEPEMAPGLAECENAGGLGVWALAHSGRRVKGQRASPSNRRLQLLHTPPRQHAAAKAA